MKNNFQHGTVAKKSRIEPMTSHESEFVLFSQIALTLQTICMDQMPNRWILPIPPHKVPEIEIEHGG